MESFITLAEKDAKVKDLKDNIKLLEDSCTGRQQRLDYYKGILIAGGSGANPAA